MLMNRLSRWHGCSLAPVTSSAGEGIISAGLPREQASEQGESRTARFRSSFWMGFCGCFPAQAPSSSLPALTLLFPDSRPVLGPAPLSCAGAALLDFTSLNTHPAAQQTKMCIFLFPGWFSSSSLHREMELQAPKPPSCPMSPAQTCTPQSGVTSCN